MSVQQLLSLSQMARRLGVTVAWLKEEAQAGRVPSLDAGGRFLFVAEVVEEALLERAGYRPAEATRVQQGAVVGGECE